MFARYRVEDYIAAPPGLHDFPHALLDVVASHNGGDAEAAAEYLVQLQSEGRYGRDVY